MTRRKYTAEQFIKAIEGSGAIISTIATRVGCQWDTANRWVTTVATVKTAYQNELMRMNDLARATILSSIKEGNTSDARWWLARKCREEFGDNVDVTSGREPIRFTVRFADDIEADAPEDTD